MYQTNRHISIYEFDLLILIFDFISEEIHFHFNYLAKKRRNL
jgi:hypothetical protein